MELQVVVARLGEEAFGVPIEQVKEIIRLVQVTAVPKAPEGVLGVVNLRGGVIPVVSLRDRFGFQARDADEATRIVVSDVAGQTVGFVVDEVTEVLRLSQDDIEASPVSVSTAQSAFIKGIGKLGERLIIMLDLEKVFDFSVLAGTV